MVGKIQKKAGRGFTREEWIKFHQRIVQRSETQEENKMEERMSKMTDFL